MSQVQQFYTGKKIFVTGGTGFLGKILIEKLLRSCPDLGTVYFLIRPKKGKTIQERIDSLFDDEVFEVLRSEYPDFSNKIVGVGGDVGEERLGLSNTDYALIVDEVSVIFHLAATIRFNEKLEKAITVNVNSVKSIVDIAKACKNLKAGIYVSTAYSNCLCKSIKEELCSPPLSFEAANKFIEDVGNKKWSDNELADFTTRVLGEWPNTYSFTKAIAEGVVAEFAKELPFAVFRPSIEQCISQPNYKAINLAESIEGSAIEPYSTSLYPIYSRTILQQDGNQASVSLYQPNFVTLRLNHHLVQNIDVAKQFEQDPMFVVNTYREPIPGWLAGPIGFPGIYTGIGIGIVHVYIIDEENGVDIVPVDYVCNALLSCAWETAITERRHDEDIPVYNYVTGNENPITWKHLGNLSRMFGNIYPSNAAIYYTSIITTKFDWIYYALEFFLHLIPALMIDSIARLTGKQPGLYKLALKVREAAFATKYFTTHQWDFENQRVQNLWKRIGPQDKLTFPFSMQNVDWDEYAMKMVQGFRKFLIRYPDDNLEQARRRRVCLFIIHVIVQLTFVIFVLWIIWKIFCGRSF